MIMWFYFIILCLINMIIIIIIIIILCLCLFHILIDYMIESITESNIMSIILLLWFNRLHLLWFISIIISHYSPSILLLLLLYWLLLCLLPILILYTPIFILIGIPIYFMESHVFHLCLLLFSNSWSIHLF